MLYPTEILPSHDHKCLETDVERFLIRYTSSNNPDYIWDDSTDTINIKCVCSPVENIYDLSTSLYGIFTEQHCYIGLSGEGNKIYNHYCECNYENSDIPIHIQHFDLVSNRGYFYVKIGDINMKRAEYTNEKEQKTFIAECCVVHSPMMWNYWHFSIRWNITIPNDLPFTDNMKKKLGSEARALIAHFSQKRI